MRLIVPLLLAIAIAAPASAQNSAWSYKAIIYAWVPGMDTSFDTAKFGTIEGSSSTTDVLEDLEFAFMGTFEAQTGRFSLIGDLLYTSLSMPSNTPKGFLFDQGIIDTSVSALSGYGLYRVSTDPAIAFDLGVGFRAFSVDATATLVGNKVPTETVGDSESWVDPLVAGRLIVPFNDRWSGSLFADYGSAGSSTTWQGIATVNYALSESWTMNAGYRTMTIEKDLLTIPTTIELSGPLIGFSYNF